VRASRVTTGSQHFGVSKMGLGEAAGTAAALSIREGISPRQLSADRLCAVLDTARNENKAPEWCP
jgi:hypothetical protein